MTLILNCGLIVPSFLFVHSAVVQELKLTDTRTDGVALHSIDFFCAFFVYSATWQNAPSLSDNVGHYKIGPSTNCSIYRPSV